MARKQDPLSARATLPKFADTVVIGGGTSGAAIATRTQLEAFVRANCLHYCHPVGTCKMGPASDRTAVVDSRGRIHGIDNAYVADASIMPVIPRANTNIPALVVGERIARWLLER
ncbi:MAG TPA: GMC family oxidoreductase [Candidatus Limnocylindrales bacterium]|nr:GMC family oxidoreductase [Candidatus Limnocylindrales bacterium]